MMLFWSVRGMGAVPLLEDLVFSELRFSHLGFSVVNYHYPQEPLKSTDLSFGVGYTSITKILL
jgi:hypothetical protein